LSLAVGRYHEGMAHLEIPIPDDVDERQRAALTGWLTELAHQRIAGDLAGEDDPAWHAEAVRRIKQGVRELDEGKGISLDEFKRRIADRFGIAPP